jgi:hypothetical protein
LDRNWKMGSRHECERQKDTRENLESGVAAAGHFQGGLQDNGKVVYWCRFWL